MIIFVATQGYLDDMPIEWVKPFERAFYGFIEDKYADIPHDIRETKQLDDKAADKLKGAVKEFKEKFVAEHGIKLATASR
jgi:F-type H+-transporting ATPase subunit alpha